MSRISYRNYPVLKNYHTTWKGKKEIDNSSCQGLFTQLKVIYAEDFSKNLMCPSSTFLETAAANASKFLKLTLEDLKDGANTLSGSVIILTDVVFYRFVLEKDTFLETLLVSDKAGKAKFALFETLAADGNVQVHGMDSFNKGASFFRAYADTLNSLLLCTLAFKKYAQVEIVESKARTKIHVQGCKYLNETDLDVEYLDSKWFTSLVNSKGFKVGGHFRLQPKKKEGEWTKELIWIADFDKKGYNRKAGILK